MWVGILAAQAGCAEGVRWRAYSFDSVFADSVRDGKLTFVYFRSWSDVGCTRFEEDVLKDAAVLKATRDLYCVPLEYSVDRPLASQWNIVTVPGVVILDPRRRVLVKLSGAITKQQLLDGIAVALQQYAASVLPRPSP